MLTGLDILIDRMKTNPEEFLHTSNVVPYEGESFGGRWSDLVDYAWRVATEEERKALEDARREFYRDDFNERVMKRLAGEEVKQEQPSPYIVKQNTAQAIKNPIQNAAAQQQMLQNSVLVVGGGGSGGSGLGAQGAVLQGGQYDPNLHGYLTTTGSTGFQAAETKQEGATISTNSSFWNGVIASGKGKLW